MKRPVTAQKFPAAPSTEDKPLTRSKGPRPLPDNWARPVGRKIPRENIETIQNAIKRGCPLGEISWIAKTAERFELESTLKPGGRPKNKKCP